MNWIILRLREPSTWAGFAIIAGSVGQAFPEISTPCHVVAMVCGTVAVALKEGANTPKP